MKQETISFKSMLAGTILKLDFVDSIDITLIMASLKLLGIEVGNHELGNLKDYVVFNNGIMKKVNSIKDEVLNVKLVLHKIKLLFVIKKDNLNNLFNKQELDELYKLLEQGYIEFKGTDNKELVLTKKGLVKLFIEKNYIEVSKFQEMLSRLNYDLNLFEEFLETVDDLDNYVLNEKTILEFENFCGVYDLSSKI